MQEITQGMKASDAPTVDELLLVAEGSAEFLFCTSRVALLQISSPLSTSESKGWLNSQNVDAKLAKVDRAMPQALKNTLYFFSFQKPCEEQCLLRKASVDPAEAADWAFHSGRWSPQCRRRLVRLCNNWRRCNQSQIAARGRRCPSLLQRTERS